MRTEHIVVIGGGFGGVYVTKKLLKGGNHVTLIDPTNSFIFTPLLAEVATGNLSPRDVVFEYSSFFKSKQFSFVRGRAESFDAHNRTVCVDGKDISYDWLVLATGATTHFFNTPGQEHAMTLKNLEDASAIKRRVLELAQGVTRDVSISIVGGGPTGVEFAGEMEQFLSTIERYNKGVKCHVRLIEGGPALIRMFSPRIQKYAHTTLEQSGVSVHVNERVERITDTEIVTDKSAYPSDIVVWTAGVKPHTHYVPKDLCDESGNVVVDETLKVIGCAQVYAIGDIISINGVAVPKLAQTAVDEAHVVARNIASRIKGGSGNKKYTLKLQGALISVGKWRGAGDVFGMSMTGPHMWLLWRGVYFFKNPGLLNKFEVGFSWFINMFTGRSLDE